MRKWMSKPGRRRDGIFFGKKWTVRERLGEELRGQEGVRLGSVGDKMLLFFF